MQSKVRAMEFLDSLMLVKDALASVVKFAIMENLVMAEGIQGRKITLLFRI